MLKKEKMIHIFSENGILPKEKIDSFRDILYNFDLKEFKSAVNNRNVQKLIDWCNSSKEPSTVLLFYITFIPCLIYMLSSEDPIFASNFLHQFIKRNNIRHVNLHNLVLLKFEDYIGVDKYFLSDCLIEEFSMLSNNVDNYNFKNCHIKKLEVDEDWDTNEIVDHFKALGTTIDEIIEI